MSEEKQTFASLLDELSLNLVMADPDNLISLGEILSQVESVEKASKDIDSDFSDGIIAALKKILESIIMEDVKDKARAMEILGQGLSLLQDFERSIAHNEEFKGSSADFMGAIKNELKLQGDFLGDVPDVEGKGSAGTEEKEEAPITALDLTQDKDMFFSFVTESMEHIEGSEISIVDLESDPENKEILNSIFRSFHTIKGVAGFLNLNDIHRLSHEMENLLNEARNDDITVSPTVIDLFLDGLDLLKKMIEDIQTSLEDDTGIPDDYPMEEIFARLATVQSAEEEDKGMVDEAYAGMMIGEILVDQALMTEEELDDALNNLEEGRFRKLGEILVEKGTITNEDLDEAVFLQMEDSRKKLGDILVETGKVDKNQLAQALDTQDNLRDRKLGEVIIQEGKAEPKEVAGALRDQKKAVQHASRVEQTVKVDTIKLDNLVDMVGELVIAQSQVVGNENIDQLKDQKLARDLNHMARITSELQRTAMALRMVPIRLTFQRMIRLVRDLSRKSGKEVELNMQGEDTEIDRNMVEAIYDPMVHMIRNACDHGIEAPDEREKQGKPRMGSIMLKAYHQGGGVVIEVSDDGKGLDRDKIFNKAVERGLVDADETLSDSNIFQMIFLPGFSTAEKVTAVSGRGVGMDVVKKAIDKLRGKTEIISTPGNGSTFVIRIPLTLAVIEGMVVRVGDNRYILPTLAIRETFRVDMKDYNTVQGQGEMIKVREDLLPLVRLYNILGVTPSTTDIAKGLVIVGESNDERRCLLVDEVLGKQEVVIKSLGETLKQIPGVAGGTILGDGHVGLILDVNGLFKVADNSASFGFGDMDDEEEGGVEKTPEMIIPLED